MEEGTNEFSFVLKPSNHGIGVFVVYDIKEGTHLRLFGNESSRENRVRVLPKNEVPIKFRDFCMDRGETLVCPEDFGNMPVGWYLNHSKNANAEHRDYKWYAKRDLSAGEEILIDYNSLEEPDNAREKYYDR